TAHEVDRAAFRGDLEGRSGDLFDVHKSGLHAAGHHGVGGAFTQGRAVGDFQLVLYGTHVFNLGDGFRNQGLVTLVGHFTREQYAAVVAGDQCPGAGTHRILDAVCRLDLDGLVFQLRPGSAAITG